MVAVQDFEGVAVEDGDDGAGEVSIGRCDDEAQNGRQKDEERNYSSLVSALPSTKSKVDRGNNRIDI